ncbi:MAG: hypothetical protein LAP85_29060 [Acidobacteriia bacterium]|nr:hypothetical protein [Terriglobia bacterium]
MTQSKKEIENARRERESQGAFDALQAHEKTYPAMQREYDKLDAECIKLARELAALQLAESPRAEALHGELRLARMTRDGFKYTWNRKRDSLFAGAKRVEELRLQPLEQINIAINEVVAKFENAEFPMEVIELTGRQWQELTAVAAQQESQDRLVYKRI